MVICKYPYISVNHVLDSLLLQLMTQLVMSFECKRWLIPSLPLQNCMERYSMFRLECLQICGPMVSACCGFIVHAAYLQFCVDIPNVIEVYPRHSYSLNKAGLSEIGDLGYTYV